MDITESQVSGGSSHFRQYNSSMFHLRGLQATALRGLSSNE